MTVYLPINDFQLTLLPERAVYIEAIDTLLVSDVHLGKSETFQHFGIPISSQVNLATLNRLRQVCDRTQASNLWILGDLFHSQAGLVEPVIDGWLHFLNDTQVSAHLVLGNHDRALVKTLEQLSLTCHTEAVITDCAIFSHEPWPQTDQLNICGHVHPVVRLQGGGDRLRLPCFFWEAPLQRLTLPAFGEFTGGYEMAIRPQTVAFAIASDRVVPFAGAGVKS